MNNQRARVIMMTLRPGARVTVRARDGRTVTGRAREFKYPGSRSKLWACETRPGHLHPVTAANLIRVAPP
jgi:hypothetical protein